MANEVMVTVYSWNAEAEQFASEAIQTKEDLLDELKKFRQAGAKALHNGVAYSAAFYEALDGLLEEFIKRVELTNLPDPLPEAYSDEKYAEVWSYGFDIDVTGIKLVMLLDTMDRPDMWSEDERMESSWGESFTLIEIPCELPLTEEEKKSTGRSNIIRISNK